MKFHRTAAAFLLAFTVHHCVLANPTVEQLSHCMADNTSGKDRKDLARWVFSAMAVHPDMGAVAKVNPEVTQHADKTFAQLVTRLIAEVCSKEMKQVIQSVGASGVRIAFEKLGAMAMQELMSNPAVDAAMNSWEKHADTKKLDAVFGQP
jgi:hypothetical protein